MPKERRICRVSVQSSLLLLVLLLGSSACRPREINLSFETIEQRDWAGTGQAYEAREPGLMVITQAEDMAALDDWITEDAKSQLEALDYDTHFALIVLQGWKPTNGYAVEVKRIACRENAVNVYAEFREPQPDEAKADVVTSPYHLIQIQKDGEWGQDTTFNVVVDDTVVASLSRYVP
jgi:hypothetical protein